MRNLYVVTGAAGFIASVLVKSLINKGKTVVAVDDFSRLDKKNNFHNKGISEFVDRNSFFNWLEKNASNVHVVFHLGARTDTTLHDRHEHQTWNTEYSKSVWRLATQYNIPLIYASSAATYGDGALGYKDDHKIVEQLKPLNEYGISKNDFDIWAIKQNDSPPFWAGLKFFNVYGPNEYHKGRMASVIFHAFNQIKTNGHLKLFKSHHPDFTDGGQLRDFIYVKDVVNICIWLMQNKPESGLYNVGTGTARTFLDLGLGVFRALNKEPQIDFIDTPLDIRDKYQYFTEASMDKLISQDYTDTFYSLESGIEDYVKNYLLNHSYFD